MPNTIAALATPRGIGGIAVIRISGPDSFRIADLHFKGKIKISDADSHTIHFGHFFSGEEIIDQVLISVFREPNSYTGENIIEISCHGGIAISSKILEVIIASGAEHAGPGEFTRRAFINKKIDLSQAEAVADMIHSDSFTGLSTSARQLAGKFKEKTNHLRERLLKIASLLEVELDFSEEDIEFISKDQILELIEEAIVFSKSVLETRQSAEIHRSGFFVAIAGFPNSGKSTLFNKLLSRDRAIISTQPGTTRDYLEENLILDGISIKLIDTAGIRDSEDNIEIEGIKIAYKMIKQANLVLILNDITNGINYSNKIYTELKSRFPETEIILIQNKIDLKENFINDKKYFYLSAKFEKGIDQVKNFISQKAQNSTISNADILLNQRQAKLLISTINHLTNAHESVKSGMENEFVSPDIRKAAESLGEITGHSWNDDVLNHIFGQFCIGK